MGYCFSLQLKLLEMGRQTLKFTDPLANLSSKLWPLSVFLEHGHGEKIGRGFL